MIWIIDGFLLAVLAVKAVAYLIRWYEVSGRYDFILPEGKERLRLLVRGVWPFLHEYLVTLLIFTGWAVEAPVRLLTRRSPMKPAVKPAGKGDIRPVILVHGFSMLPWSMGFLWLILRLSGRKQLYLLDYYPMFGPIDRFVEQLEDLVEVVCDGDKKARVDLVGHSMGGLICARYTGRHPQRVARVVAVGAPFHGTRMWAMSVGASLPQMRPGSVFLKETVESEAFPGKKPVTSIYSDFDQVILPSASSKLAGEKVTNVPLTGLGHGGLLCSVNVTRAVRAALAEAPEQAGALPEPRSVNAPGIPVKKTKKEGHP